jgi:hypothetical protein
MSSLNGWITFREIVDSVQLATEGTDSGQFMRKLNFAIKGYEDLRLFQLPATKPVTLPISGEMRIVVLPEDFLKFVSIGTMYSGRFYPFAPNSEMPTVTTGSCGVDSRTLPTNPDPNAVVFYRGYYTVDLERHRIIIDAPLTVTEVVLNYTPTGIKRDGETFIPRMCREVIEAYVEYQCVLRDKTTGLDKQIFEREYIKAHNKFRGLQYNTDELFNEYYKHLETGRQY